VCHGYPNKMNIFFSNFSLIGTKTASQPLCIKYSMLQAIVVYIRHDVNKQSKMATDLTCGMKHLFMIYSFVVYV